jgi:hypothetical protein
MELSFECSISYQEGQEITNGFKRLYVVGHEEPLFAHSLHHLLRATGDGFRS